MQLIFQIGFSFVSLFTHNIKVDFFIYNLDFILIENSLSSILIFFLVNSSILIENSLYLLNKVSIACSSDPKASIFVPTTSCPASYLPPYHTIHGKKNKFSAIAALDFYMIIMFTKISYFICNKSSNATISRSKKLQKKKGGLFFQSFLCLILIP